VASDLPKVLTAYRQYEKWIADGMPEDAAPEFGA
jgi:hypothetical protein